MDNSFISPVANPSGRRGGGLSGKFVFIIIGLVITALIAAGLLLISGGGDPAEKLDAVNAKLTELQLLIENGEQNAKSGDIRKINTDARILLVNDIALMSEVSLAAGADGSTQAPAVSEDEDPLLERLNTAAVNGQYDEVYVPELIEAYEEAIVLLASLERDTTSAAIKSAALTTRKHAETITLQLQALVV